MTLLVFFCAKGAVIWLLQGSARTGTKAVCEQDQFTVTYSRTPLSSLGTGLRAIAAHSVALQGSIQSFSTLSL